MKKLILGLVAAVCALCAGCMSPHEGEHANFAGADVEGLAWKVKCGETTQRALNQRMIDEFGNVRAAEDRDLVLRQDDGRAYVAVEFDHYWAGRELEACRR